MKLQKGWEGIEMRHFHVVAKTPRVLLVGFFFMTMGIFFSHVH